MIEWFLICLTLFLLVLLILLCSERHGIVLAYHSTSVRENNEYTLRPKRVMRIVRTLQCLGYKSGFGELLSADNIVQAVARRWFLITFDDAYRDNFHFILWLLERNYKVMVFLPTAHLGSVNHWDNGDKKLLTIEQVTYLADHGAVFASHGHTHQRMTEMDKVQLENEVCESRTEIQKLNHGRDDCLAYPYGDHNSEVMDLMERAGVRYAFSTIPRQVNVRNGDQDFQIGRLSMRRDWRDARFLLELLLMRFRGWKQILRNYYA